MNATKMIQLVNSLQITNQIYQLFNSYVLNLTLHVCVCILNVGYGTWTDLPVVCSCIEDKAGSFGKGSFRYRLLLINLCLLLLTHLTLLLVIHSQQLLEMAFSTEGICENVIQLPVFPPQEAMQGQAGPRCFSWNFAFKFLCRFLPLFNMSVPLWQRLSFLINPLCQYACRGLVGFWWFFFSLPY